MSAEKIDRVIREYVSAATLHGDAIKIGDHKAANRHYSQLRKIYRDFEQDRDLAESTLMKLFRHPNASVRIWASAHALGLGTHDKEAVSILQQLAADNSIEILR